MPLGISGNLLNPQTVINNQDDTNIKTNRYLIRYQERSPFWSECVFCYPNSVLEGIILVLNLSGHISSWSGFYHVCETPHFTLISG